MDSTARIGMAAGAGDAASGDDTNATMLSSGVAPRTEPAVVRAQAGAESGTVLVGTEEARLLKDSMAEAPGATVSRATVAQPVAGQSGKAGKSSTRPAVLVAATFALLAALTGFFFLRSQSAQSDAEMTALGSSGARVASDQNSETSASPSSDTDDGQTDLVADSEDDGGATESAGELSSSDVSQDLARARREPQRGTSESRAGNNDSTARDNTAGDRARSETSRRPPPTSAAAPASPSSTQAQERVTTTSLPQQVRTASNDPPARSNPRASHSLDPCGPGARPITRTAFHVTSCLRARDGASPRRRSAQHRGSREPGGQPAVDSSRSRPCCGTRGDQALARELRSRVRSSRCQRSQRNLAHLGCGPAVTHRAQLPRALSDRHRHDRLQYRCRRDARHRCL